MFLSNDLIFTEYKNKYLAYNHLINKAVLINSYTFENIMLLKKSLLSMDEFLSTLSCDEVLGLCNSGILYKNYDEYQNQKYSNKLENRLPKIELTIAYFHITQRCNLKCLYCYNMENLNKPDKLNTSEIKLIIKKLHSKGVKTIILTGGEATIRDDILEIVKFCKELNISVNLLTNGTNIIEKIELLEYINFTIVSLDTLNKENNQRFGLNIDKLVSDLKFISNKYPTKIAVRSVISKFNINDIEEIRNFVEKSLGIAFISALFIPNNLDEIKYMVNSSDVKPDCESQNFSGNICGATYKIISIDSNGDLYPCQCLVKPKFCVGSILDDNWFEKLENHVITKDFMKRTVLDIEICKKCEYKYLCGGGCRAIAENLYNDLDAFIECLCPFQKEIAKNKLVSLIEKYG